jgi:hypothetical protein
LSFLPRSNVVTKVSTVFGEEFTEVGNDGFVPVFRHHMAEYINGAIDAGFTPGRVREWRAEGD